MGGDVVAEEVVLDGSSGVLGDQLTLQFEPGVSPTYCPPPSGPNPAGITVIGPASGPPLELTVVNLGVDGSTCPGDRDVVHAVDANLTLQHALVEYSSGTLLTGSSDGIWRLDFSRVQGGTAPIVDASGPTVFMEGVELSSHDVTGRPLIDVGSGGGVHASSSAIFGNLIRGGEPLIRAGGLFHLHHAVLAGNVVLGAPLIETDLVGNQQMVRLSKTVVSRNRLLVADATAAPAAAPAMPPLGTVSPNDLCLPFAASTVGYVQRPVPQSTGGVGDYPIFAVTGGDQLPRRLVLLVSNYFVENELGAGGALIAASGAMEFLDLALVHNTVAGFGAPLLREEGASTSVRLSTARNLIDGPSSLSLNGGVFHVETSLDSLDDSGLVFFDDIASLPGVPGPLLPLRSALVSPFMPESETTTWDDCQRVLASCPNHADCGSLEAGGVDQACALDAAIRYVADPGLSELTTTWPWKSGWFTAVDRTALAGAEGIACGAQAVPFDEVFQPFHEGDGDNFTTLVDCNNEDFGIQPSLPEYDGFSSIYCTEVQGDCYTCPEGSQEPPGDDDDDDSASDDDDAGQDDDDAGDDDDSGDDDDAGGDRVEPGPACLSSGCGVAYRCSDGSVAFLPFLLMPAARRRRRRSVRRR